MIPCVLTGAFPLDDAGRSRSFGLCLQMVIDEFSLSFHREKFNQEMYMT